MPALLTANCSLLTVLYLCSRGARKLPEGIFKSDFEPGLKYPDFSLGVIFREFVEHLYDSMPYVKYLTTEAKKERYFTCKEIVERILLNDCLYSNETMILRSDGFRTYDPRSVIVSV